MKPAPRGLPSVVQQPDIETVYRSRGIARGALGIGVLLVGVATAELVATPGTDSPAVMALIAVVTLAIGAFMILRVSRTGVYVGGDGVRVVNVWRTHELAWKDIQRFAVRSYGPARARLVGGATVDIFAIQQGNWQNMRRKINTPAAAMIARLNARLEGKRAEVAATSGRSTTSARATTWQPCWRTSGSRPM